MTGKLWQAGIMSNIETDKLLTWSNGEQPQPPFRKLPYMLNTQSNQAGKITNIRAQLNVDTFVFPDQIDNKLIFRMYTSECKDLMQTCINSKMILYAELELFKHYFLECNVNYIFNRNCSCVENTFYYDLYWIRSPPKEVTGFITVNGECLEICEAVECVQ